MSGRSTILANHQAINPAIKMSEVDIVFVGREILNISKLGLKLNIRIAIRQTRTKIIPAVKSKLIR